MEYYKSKEEALNEFIETAKEYLKEVIKICEKRERENYRCEGLLPDSAKLILAYEIMFNGSRKPEELGIHYVKRILPYSEQIEKRQESFFLDNNNLYPDVAPEHIEFIKKLWKNEDGFGFTDKQKQISWEYFEKMIESVSAWNEFLIYESKLKTRSNKSKSSK